MPSRKLTNPGHRRSAQRNPNLLPPRAGGENLPENYNIPLWDGSKGNEIGWRISQDRKTGVVTAMYTYGGAGRRMVQSWRGYENLDGTRAPKSVKERLAHFQRLASARHNPRPALRRNSASTADGSETYYATSGASSTSSSSTQRARADRAAARIAGDMEARHYAQNPRAKKPTRRDELERLADEAGYHVATYSPGDGVTRYRFFRTWDMLQKGVSPREQDYFGPLNGVHTALGLAAAKKWLANNRLENPSRKGSAKRNSKQSIGGRTAAQNNAAKAMKLFHSGQASSLAEAWAMLRRR